MRQQIVAAVVSTRCAYTVVLLFLVDVLFLLPKKEFSSFFCQSQ